MFLDLILDDLNLSFIEKFKSKFEIFFKLYIYVYGRWYFILGIGNRFVFRKLNLSELKEKYWNGKEKVKEWNVDKMWVSYVEWIKRKVLVLFLDIVIVVFWIWDGVFRIFCEVCL